MELPSFEPLFGVKDLKLAPSLGSTPELFHIIACCDFGFQCDFKYTLLSPPARVSVTMMREDLLLYTSSEGEPPTVDTVRGQE